MKQTRSNEYGRGAPYEYYELEEFHKLFDIIESLEEPTIADVVTCNLQQKTNEVSQVCMYCKKSDCIQAVCQNKIPPLKLRVGGFYKNKEKEINKITFYYRGCFFDELGRFYKENGQALPYCPPYDLIEEVQPEPQENKNEYCECLGGFVPNAIHDKCVRCLKSKKQEDSYIKKPEAHSEKKHKFDYCCATGICDPLVEKQESNPFKVGEKVRAFSVHYHGQQKIPDILTGDIKSIENDILTILGKHYHYKQCERVE